MRNHNKENVSVGSYTFPIEDLDKRILIEAFKLYDSSVDDPERIASVIHESWWKELDNMLRLYGKKGMGFYYGYMMYLNQNKSGEELKNGDINPVVAPGYKVQEQEGAGTHRVGELDGVQMIEIEGVFGLASYGGDRWKGSADGKTKMEWSIIFDDMGEMKVGPTFIYDYKQYELEPDEIDYWSIGGSNTENLLAVLLSFYRTYGDTNLITEEIDTEIKYAIDQQYRNDPEERKNVLDSLEFDPYKDRDFYVGGYKELQFDVEPRTLVNKLAQEKGYGKVVDEMLGGNGTAYFTSKGNVIKITGDKSEYETANVIKGKQNKYIADVFESGKLDSSHIISGDAYIIIMEELGLPKRISEIFEDCCCGVNKPIYIEYNETPAVIHPPVNGKEECEKLHKNLLMIRQELTQHGISWSDIGIDNLGMKNGKLALLDLGETTGGIDTGQTIELNEQEQLELELPTPIGEFEFPAGYEDVHTETGEEYAGAEQETVDAIRDEVRDESVTYLFKKWDKTGVNFDDLKLIGIPTNNSLIKIMLAKRYLKNTMRPIPVSYTFDCEDLSKMFIKDARDYSVDYIEQFLCGEHEWDDYDNWYDHDWYDGMSDDLDDRNWKTIMNILGVTTQEEAENLVNNRPQTEEEERIAEEKEEVISEIRSSILWTHNDEAEWRTKRDMGDDVIDKLGEHFNNDGKLSRDDNGKWSWTIEDNLLNWLGDDMWDNIDLYEYHPDYAGYTLEDWLTDWSVGPIQDAIFESLMLEEFTFEDYDYGKRGDLLEPNTRFFDNYYHPNYDINDGLYDRLGEIEHYSSASATPLLKEGLFEQSDAFDKGELIILKHVHKNFSKKELEDLVSETPIYGGASKKWTTLMKMFGIPTSSMEQAAISTQYAKYALDNWNEEGNYTMENPIRDMISWWDISRDETGSQVEYKSGGTDVLAFDDDDAEERGDNEFHDWDGDMETVDWGDYEAYDSEVREVEPTGRYPKIPKISEGVAGDQEKHTGEQGGFFTLDGSDNIGNTDLYKGDGFDIIHQHRGNVHLSDISPEESETSIPKGSKKIKKTVLKPRLDKGPFNIPVPMKEHYEDVESNPDLNPEVEEGDVIELLYMDDPYSIPIKTKGVVMGFEGKPGDFAYKILVNWILGPEKLTPMALLPDADIYRFPKKKKEGINEQWKKPYKDPKAVVNGKEIDLDVADTEFLKQKGMMYKTSYPRNRGMLFIWDDIVPISMWMKNTYLPLDIVYMVDGEVVDYDKDVQPCDKQQCETYGDVNANQVIELLSGGVDNYNISIGDQIELMDV